MHSLHASQSEAVFYTNMHNPGYYLSHSWRGMGGYFTQSEAYFAQTCTIQDTCTTSLFFWGGGGDTSLKAGLDVKASPIAPG